MTRAALYRSFLRANAPMDRAAGKMQIPESDTTAVVGAYVLAPALSGFVKWLLHNALADGKKRLYFLARDGYFMYRAALLFCEAFDLSVECRYLSCSRYSIRIPMYHLDRAAALDYVCRGGIDVTPGKIMARAGLTEREGNEVLESLSFPYGKYENIPFAALPEIRLAIQKSPQFLGYMEKHSRDAMPAFAGYLKQEGLLEETDYAVVDSGWVGSMQKTLGDALSHLGRKQTLEGYYWGLYDLPADVSGETYHCYYFSPEGQLKEKVHFNNCLFEAIFTAPHGMTLGYRKAGETYLPCYEPIREERKYFTEKIGTYLMPYFRILAGEYGKNAFLEDTSRKDRETTKKLLRQFMGTPAKREAAVFGSLPFSDDVLSGEDRRIAAPLTEEELRANHVFRVLPAMAGLRKKHIRESAWYEGSAVLYGKRVRRHLRQYTLYKYIRYIRKLYRYKKERREKSKNGEYAAK